MTTPERNVKEIAQHHAPFFMKYETVDQAVTQLEYLLQTERQRCEEMVEAERERIALIVRSIDFEVRQTDVRIEAAIWQSIKNLKETVLQALTQPNNPK